jgi:hypothetical protein
MDNETIRTAITAISAVLTTGAVAFFGWLSMERRNTVYKLKRELISIYQQYARLYECEASLLKMLDDAGLGNQHTLKIEVRKRVLADTSIKIIDTNESIQKKLHEINNNEY